MDPLIDRAAPGRTRSSRPAFTGGVWSVRTDDVDLGDHGVVERDVLVHPGAVAVAALDDRGRLVLVQQYRHPVQALLWELPAGMLDVSGEPMHVTAARELAEEAGLAADRWATLIDLYVSPGGSSERMRILLAEQVRPAPRPEGFRAEHEEAGIVVAHVPVEEVVAAVLAGRVHNAALVAGAMALKAVLDERSALRPADAAWTLADA